MGQITFNKDKSIKGDSIDVKMYMEMYSSRPSPRHTALRLSLVLRWGQEQHCL